MSVPVHKVDCSCESCVSIAKVADNWIRQKASNMVAFHVQFNAGADASIDPNLAVELLRNMGMETKSLLSTLHGSALHTVHVELNRTRSLLTERDKTITELTSQLETRRAYLIRAVPSTDGRLFREE